MTAPEIIAQDAAEPIRHIRETHIAAERLKSAHKGEIVWRMPGDEMPEVDDWHWTARESYLRNHRIKVVTVGSTEPVKRSVGRPRKDG